MPRRWCYLAGSPAAWRCSLCSVSRGKRLREDARAQEEWAPALLKLRCAFAIQVDLLVEALRSDSQPRKGRRQWLVVVCAVAVVVCAFTAVTVVAARCDGSCLRQLRLPSATTTVTAGSNSWLRAAPGRAGGARRRRESDAHARLPPACGALSPLVLVSKVLNLCARIRSKCWAAVAATGHRRRRDRQSRQLLRHQPGRWSSREAPPRVARMRPVGPGIWVLANSVGACESSQI